MEVTAKKNLIYSGEIYRAGEKFECKDVEKLTKRGLIERAEIAQLPSLEDEIKRKRR